MKIFMKLLLHKMKEFSERLTRHFYDYQFNVNEIFLYFNLHLTS